MNNQDFIQLIEKRLTELESKINQLVDRELCEGIRNTLSIAQVDLPFSLAKARVVLETVITDIYRREFPDKKPKPLFDMIEALCKIEGLFSKKLITDVNYIRINGNLIVHKQGEVIEVSERDVEVIVLQIVNIVEWYLTQYTPKQSGETPALANLPIPDCPYRGLAAFREQDQSNFFGREKDIVELVEWVKTESFIVIIGNSGSGKSSLVYAGVIPTLRQQGWQIASLRPQNDVFYQLASALTPLVYEDAIERGQHNKSLSRALVEQKIDLWHFIQTEIVDKQEKPLLLFIDQFEELFSHHSSDQQTICLDILLSLLQQLNAANFCLMITLRADFVSQALLYPPFAESLDCHQQKLLSGHFNEDDAVRHMIEQPAKNSGVQLETLLVERILRDLQVDNQQISLPLLQFTLEALWQTQQDRTLSHSAYENLGGVQQALSKRADQIYAQLDKTRQQHCRQVLVQLVHPGEGTEDTRQLAHRQQIQHWDLVQKLADQRLLVTGHDEFGETVEVIHEVLIRYWQPLRQWMNEDRKFRLWQEELRRQLQRWQASQDNSELLRGARLLEAEEFSSERNKEVSQSEHEFVASSVALRDKEIQERERRRRQWMGGLVIFLVLVSGLAGLAGWQWQLAKQKTEEVEVQKKGIEEKLLEADHNLGLAFFEKAKQALKRKNFNEFKLYALNALNKLQPESDSYFKVLSTVYIQPDYPVRYIVYPANHHDDNVNSLAFSPDGTTLVSGSDDDTLRLWDVASGQQIAVLTGHTSSVTSVAFSPDGTALVSGSWDDTLRLWNVANGEQIAVLTGHTDDVNSVAFSPDGITLVSGSDDDTLRLWDVVNRQKKTVLTGHTDDVTSVVFSPDGATFVSGSWDDTLRLWDATSGQQLAVLGHTHSVSSVAFSPDGTTLVSGSWDDTLHLWDVASERQIAVLTGHTDDVTSIAFLPDGTTLVSGSEDNSLRLWDVTSKQQIAVLTGHTDEVTSVAFSPDGTTLISGSADNTLRLWDIGRDDQTAVLIGHTDFVTSVAFSPDGTTLVAGSQDNLLRLWDIASGQQVAVLTGHTGSSNVSIIAYCISSITFSPDGTILVSGSGDNTLRLWNVANGEQLAVLTGHTHFVTSVAFSPDGTTLVSGSGDNTLRLWDVVSGQQIAVLTGHTDFVTSVAFSPDGTTLASGSWDDTLRLWDVASGRQLAVLTGHTDHVTSVAFSPDGTTFVSGSRDETLRLWDVVSRQQLAVLVGHTDDVTSVAFSPDGATLVSGSEDNTLRLWDVASRQKVAELTGHTDFVTSVAFSPDGTTLVSGSEDNSLRLWDIVSRQKKVVLTGHADFVMDVDFSSDGTTVVSGSFDDTLRLWDITSGQQIAVSTGLMDSVSSVAFSPDGTTLVAGSWDHTLRLWDIASGRQLAVLTGHTNWVNSVAFSPDGTTLVSGSSDNTLRLWDVASGQQLAVLTGHTNSVASVAFSPDGTTLVSGSSDLTLRLWDVASGQQIAVLTGHTGRVSSVAFSPDGTALVSGSADNSLRLWNIANGTQIAMLTGNTSYTYWSVTSVAFSPDGTTLAWGVGNTLHLWDIANGEQLAVLTGHTRYVTSVAFSPDGTTLVSGSEDETLIRWSLTEIANLSDKQYIIQSIQQAEVDYQLYLDKSTLKSNKIEPNLFERKTKPHRRKTHPFHWPP